MTTPGDTADGHADWRPTAAQVRAVTIGALALLIGVLNRRLDLIVLAAPFVIAAAWAARTRPAEVPTARMTLTPSVVTEGDLVTWQADLRVPPGARDVVAVLAPTPFVVADSPAGEIAALTLGAGQRHTASVRVSTTRRARRWGLYDTGAAVLSATTVLGAFRWTPGQIRPTPLVVLPDKDGFRARAGMPHPDGVVGLNRGLARGEGSDFAAMRAYGPGDRLSRINWRRSTRSGELQVSATHADLDTHITIIVDAFHDIGLADGIGSASSSLDTSVRAATALAEHYLRAGERVGLLILGSKGALPLRPRAGRAQVRRVQDNLARIRPGTLGITDDEATATAMAQVRPGAVVLILTPAISRAALAQAMRLGQRGTTVVVIDTLPPSTRQPLALTERDLDALAPMRTRRDLAITRTAWRLRMLERDGEIHRLVRSGVPVVPWVRHGSLDEVLRQLQRRARAPRAARR